MPLALWFAGWIGLVIAAAVASGRERATPGDIVGRRVIVAAALAYAGLVVAAIWVWGGSDAAHARAQRIAEGAQVRISLRELRIAPNETRAFEDRARWFVARAGDAIRIGGGDPLPGVTTWDVLGGPGPSTMLAVPLDPTLCEAWGTARATASGCLVDEGAFTLEVVPIVPDDALVVERGARAAIVIGAPVLLALFVLAFAPRRHRRVRTLSKLLRLAAIGTGLVALVEWRLLWAYRIDVLRDLAIDGTRVADAEIAAVAIGAMLAALSATVAIRRRTTGVTKQPRAGTPTHAAEATAVQPGAATETHDANASALQPEARLPGTSLLGYAAIVGGAWAGWLAACVAALHADRIEEITATRSLGVFGLALCAALLPLAVDGAKRARRVGADVVLAALGCAALAARELAPATPLLKLALAYAAVLASYGGLRALVDATLAQRVRMLAALVAMLAALALYDAGVTIAIAGTGLVLSMLVVGHEAMYRASHAERIGVLEREHARVLFVHAIAAAAIAVGVAVAAIVIEDRTLLAYGPRAIVHVPIVIAGLFGASALLARSHRRGWAPWIAAALAALALWGMRDDLLERATAGEHVSARRVAALVEPGYALLRDDTSFSANATAWREAAEDDIDPWHGQGYFAARIRDPGVARSIDNDYVPVLVVREAGIGGIVQSLALLLVLVVAAAAFAAMRLGHASGAQRARTLVLGVVGALAIYQPLAALGVVPLTGISWPGLGIDSPADLWVFVLVLIGCGIAGEAATDDERVRRTPRLVRARRVAIGAVALIGVASGALVARAAACALDRVPGDDERVTAAVRYADSLACEVPEREAATLAEALSPKIVGTPSDAATARYDAELQQLWQRERATLLAHAESCTGRAGGWRFTREAPGGGDAPNGDAAAAPGRDTAAAAGADTPRDTDVERVCTASLSLGWPTVRVAIEPRGAGVAARCEIVRDDAVLAAVRTKPAVAPAPRVRVVSALVGAAARDAGELVTTARIIRLRAGAPALALDAKAAASLAAAGRVTLAPDVSIEVVERGARLHGTAELFVAGANGGWRPLIYSGELVLDRPTLISLGAQVVLYRPTAGDTLLADETRELGDRARRYYAHGAALPELGWVNPFDVRHSVGLDGWIHAALAAPTTSAPAPAMCGTLELPSIDRARVCAPGVDGVMECRVTLQPELAAELRTLADALIAKPATYTGRDVVPTRVAYVAMRGDTGEILAQGNIVPGRPALAYAPRNAADEAELVRLRDERSESDRERAEWNLPIAVGSLFKPVLARAAEQAFPTLAPSLELAAIADVAGCKARRGKKVSPIMGHCPATSVAGTPNVADLHEFLARSPNWYQAALGLVGLGLPDGTFTAGPTPVTFADIARSDLGGWPVDMELGIADRDGTILGARGLSVAGMRRTPLWRRTEQLLGRPLCTLGDRASCERAAARRDVCAARGLPIAAPTADLRYLVALGPDRIDPYGDDRPSQSTIPVREYLQLLRGSGVHALGSLAQITDAFGRVIYDQTSGAPKLAASWFPVPATGVVPSWSCSAASGRTATVLGADGGLCGVLRAGGTAQAALAATLGDQRFVVYGAKTGTIDSLADVARRPAACRAWNKRHAPAAQLACGKVPPDDSLFVIAFGVVTPEGTIPITLGIQLQRAGAGGASRAAPAFMRVIADYLRGA